MPAILMRVAGLAVDERAKSPIVLLKDESDKRVLPIYIGLMEAHAIALELEKVKLPRPMTHDLLAAVIRTLGGTLRRIEVVELRDTTYFARLYIEANGVTVDVDARPSDSIALALRMNAPIWVDETVLAQAAEKTEHGPGDDEDGDIEAEKKRWKEFLENLSPDDFGKYPM